MQQEHDNSLPPADRPGEDAPPSPEPTRAGMAVPRSLYVWLILLLLSFALPAVLPSRKQAASAAGEQTLSATDFSDLAQAETKVRGAFGVEALQSGLGSLGGAAEALNGKRSQKQTLLDDAAKTYRSLLKSQPTPGIVRRILIIDHAREKPLDKSLVTGALPAALKVAGVKPEKIAQEQRLWRGIYGKPVSVSGADLPAFSRLLQDTNLRFLKNRALADLYLAAGKPDQAAPYEKSFSEAARLSAVQQGGLSIALVCVGLVGFVMLIVFLVAASTRNWRLVKRQATLPQVMGWGDLLDAFVFYLAFAKAAGLVVGLVVSRLAVDPKPETMLTLYASIQAGTGLAALLYLWRTAQKRGVTLADIGLRAPRGLLSEIGYGIAGYCAVLPVVISLGLLSRLIFEHDQTRTPNPIMPLMAAEQDPLRRVVIFLMVAVGAPLFEEIFFRGALFSGLRTRYGWVLSAAISGIVFAIAHPPQDWLPIFGLGFAFATMREMRQSLAPTITAHFLQNTLAFIGTSLLFGS
ncbi:MAG: type II CAAX endopeptidase family protein [Armatimonadota bacterium]